MNYTLQLVDHTICEALKKNMDGVDFSVIGTLLGKYPIKIYDINFEECCIPERLVFPCYFRMICDPNLSKLAEAEKFGFDTIALNWSDGNAFDVLERALAFCSEFALNLHIKLNNASTPVHNYSMYQKLVERYGIKSIIFCDAMAVLDPFKTIEKLNKMKSELSCEIEFCANDEIGLASANTLSAIQCGIEKIHTVIGGIGSENSAAMEEVLLIYNHFVDAVLQVKTSNLAEECTLIMRLLGFSVSVNKPVIGGNIFAHESGIHVDGIMKNSNIYEIFSPAEVGLDRKVVIGKHSGKASIRAKLSEYGYMLNEACLTEFLGLVKKASVQQKCALTDYQFINLYNLFVKSEVIQQDKISAG